MKIESLVIDNFKSLNNFKLENPNPFSVLVGANGVGKSNIFEALEFLNYSISFQYPDDLFGGYKNFINCNRYDDELFFGIYFENTFPFEHRVGPYEVNEKKTKFSITVKKTIESRDIGAELNGINTQEKDITSLTYSNGIVSSFLNRSVLKESLHYTQFVNQFSRIFINATEKKKLNTTSDNKLNLDCSNLEKVLKRLLSDSNKREDIIEWLSLFIPAFKNIEISSDELSGTDTLLFYEKNPDRPFTKNLISDGTYNILCLLAAIYQSDEPQFICIEEPENGLNPYVVKELVTFFREQCKEKGHYIWLNTHSQTLVNQLKPEEIIVVNKENGNTIAKQFIGKDMHGMAMDTAWLTNYFGGGVPW